MTEDSLDLNLNTYFSLSKNPSSSDDNVLNSALDQFTFDDLNVGFEDFMLKLKKKKLPFQYIVEVFPKLCEMYLVDKRGANEMRKPLNLPLASKNNQSIVQLLSEGDFEKSSDNISYIARNILMPEDYYIESYANVNNLYLFQFLLRFSQVALARDIFENTRARTIVDIIKGGNYQSESL